MKRPRFSGDVFEVIVRDRRDITLPEPESSSGLLFSESEARTALSEIIASGDILSWHITKNGTVIDKSE